MGVTKELDTTKWLSTQWPHLRLIIIAKCLFPNKVIFTSTEIKKSTYLSGGYNSTHNTGPTQPHMVWPCLSYLTCPAFSHPGFPPHPAFFSPTHAPCSTRHALGQFLPGSLSLTFAWLAPTYHSLAPTYHSPSKSSSLTHPCKVFQRITSHHLNSLYNTYHSDTAWGICLPVDCLSSAIRMSVPCG